MDFSQLLSLAQENWVVTGIVAIITLLIIVSLFRAMFKIAIILLIGGFVLVQFFGFTPSEVMNIGKDAINKATTMYTSTVQPIIEKELEGADYIINEDGTYIIKTESVTIRGKKGNDIVTVNYKDNEFDVNIASLGNMVQEQINQLEGQLPSTNSQ